MRLIDANALGIGKAKREAFSTPAYADGWNSAIDIIENAPTISPDSLRPKGRWEWYDFTVSQRSIDRGYMCPVCAFKQEDETNFCPNCGADMREEKSDDT